MVQAGDYVPFLVQVTEDRDSAHVVLTIGDTHFTMSQADIARYRADAPQAQAAEPGLGIQAP